MEIVLNKPFNTAQVELIQLLDDNLEDMELVELRQLLVAFRFKLAEERAERIAETKKWTEEKINGISQAHHRTSRTVNPESPMAKGLIKMIQHKKLREQFWLGELTFEELNKQLLELGIHKQYEHPSAV